MYSNIINKELFFDDLNDFWEFSMQDSNAYVKSSRKYWNDNWAGTKTWEEAKELALKGWIEGINEVDKYKAEILPFIADKILRPIQNYAMAGYNIDIGTYLANQPEYFISRTFEERNYPGRIFTIVVSMSFSSSITPKIIIQRGAMVCALIDAIEYAGHRAEVICNNALCKNEVNRKGNNKKKGWFETSVVVKKTNQPLEMSDLAFCLVHPSMLRRIMFSLAEFEGWSDFARNYGYPAIATNKGDIYIEEIYAKTVTHEKTIGWVLEQLKKLGIDLETT